MSVYLYISYFLLLIMLAFVFYQDYTYRAVSWIIFPFIAMLGFFISMQRLPFQTVMLNSLLNLAFLSAQLVLISLYFSLRKWKISWILHRYLGLGDVLFLFAIIFLFNPVNYIVFLILGFALSLLISAFYFAIYKPTEKHIPLAGILSLILAIFVLIRIFVDLDLLLDDTLFFGLMLTS